jgi:asparagine synthase (glutamine-hydrolysing)
MCGINGILHFSNQKIDQKVLCQMRDALQHRGPDDAGIFIDNNLGLGHRRLSILDVSSAGHQPFISENQRFAMVFNGEIYNFKDFYAEIKSQNINIKTKSDTEILMILFELYGISMLNRLNGMFAIAIWDRQDKKLILIRDRMGVKPLYYAFYNQSIYFASEQKALFTAGIQLQIAESGLQEYVFNRFVAGENTLYKNIHKILPGHVMEINNNGQNATKKWWHLADEIKSHHPIKNPVTWYRETFDASIKLRMVSDVPVGIMLSGGLDSSSVLASLYAQKFSKIQTYTIGFEETEHDESFLAKKLTEQFDYGFNKLILQDDDLFQKLVQATFNQDEPLMHLNEPHLLAISELAKPKVKVLLSGEGADELMGGYVRYKALKNKNLLHVIGALSGISKFTKNPRYDKLFRYASLKNDADLITFNGSNLYPKDIHKEFGIQEAPQNDYRNQILAEAKTLYPNNLQRQALFFDQHTYLCSLLDRNDRCTMGASIECREPFLDPRLIVGLGTLPNQWLFTGKKGKYVQLKAMENRLPSQILNFKKMGLSTPWMNYLTKNERFVDEVENFRKSPIFNLPYLENINQNELVKQLKQKNGQIIPYIVPLFMMHIWYKNYVEKF